MATPVDFTRDHLSFGAVSPNSSGPDISVDPSFGPPHLSFAGAVQIKNVPETRVSRHGLTTRHILPSETSSPWNGYGKRSTRVNAAGRPSGVPVAIEASCLVRSRNDFGWWITKTAFSPNTEVPMKKHPTITGFVAAALLAAAAASIMRSYSPSTDLPIASHGMVSFKELTAAVNKLPTEDFDDQSLVYSRGPKR